MTLLHLAVWLAAAYLPGVAPGFTGFPRWFEIVAHAVGVRAWFLANRAGEPADLVECIAGTIVKDNEEDRARLRRYFEQRVATHKEAHWQAYYQAPPACQRVFCD